MNAATLRNIAAILAGLLFGTGLAVSQMVNPLKVLAFLDVLGHWDPSLAFVMGGAIAVTLPGFYLLRTMSKPVLAPGFQWPERQDIDRQLLLGAGLFGIGWGMAGYCPGPGIGAMALNIRETAFYEPLIFTASMTAGFFIWHWIERRQPPHADH